MWFSIVFCKRLPEGNQQNGGRNGRWIPMFFHGLRTGKSPCLTSVNHHVYHPHRIHGAGIYANIGGVLMVNVTIYSIHGSYGIFFYGPSIPVRYVLTAPASPAASSHVVRVRSGRFNEVCGFYDPLREAGFPWDGHVNSYVSIALSLADL